MDLLFWNKYIWTPNGYSLENASQINNKIQVETRSADQLHMMRQVGLLFQHHE